MSAAGTTKGGNSARIACFPPLPRNWANSYKKLFS